MFCYVRPQPLLTVTMGYLLNMSLMLFPKLLCNENAIDAKDGVFSIAYPEKYDIFPLGLYCIRLGYVPVDLSTGELELF